MNNSIDCHYSIIGKGPALFLIHGIGAAEDAWRFVTPKLSKHFTVITYDLRGHGKSPVTHKNFNLNDLIMDLERIRELSKFEKGHFVGHSLGGMIAPMYAKKFPEKTLSIGLLSTVAGRSNQDTKNLLNVIKNMELNGIEKTLSTLTTRWFTDNFINHNKNIVKRRLKQVIETDPEVFLNVFKIYAKTEMFPDLKNITKPCLLLTGELDLGCSPNHNKKMANEIINSKIVILSKVKHSILIEQPDKVAENLINFISKLKFWFFFLFLICVNLKKYFMINLQRFKNRKALITGAA